MATRIYPKLSTRNIDAETLSEIQSRRSQRDADLLTKYNSQSMLPSSPSIKNTQNESQSFWRDFGPLEVTTCVAKNGKQVSGCNSLVNLKLILQQATLKCITYMDHVLNLLAPIEMLYLWFPIKV